MNIMSKLIKVLIFAVLGSIVGWLLWFLIYLSNKTPAIEFDGPAGLGMILSTTFGAIVFISIGLSKSK